MDTVHSGVYSQTEMKKVIRGNAKYEKVNASYIHIYLPSHYDATQNKETPDVLFPCHFNATQNKHISSPPV
jgi:hypothetical protein